MRTPVAANTAFANAGATGGIGGSPTPRGSASLSTITTLVSRGAAGIRISGALIEGSLDVFQGQSLGSIGGGRGVGGHGSKLFAS